MQHRINNKKLSLTLILWMGVVYSGLTNAAGPSWQPLNEASQADESLSILAEQRSQNTQQNLFRASGTAIADYLLMAPHESSGDQTFLIDIPLPHGNVETFVIVESPIELPIAGQPPSNNRTYKLTGSQNSNLSGRADVTSKGFRAMIQTQDGIVLFDPEPQEGARVFRSIHPENADRSGFTCSVHEVESTGSNDQSNRLAATYSATNAVSYQARSAGNLITYRLAVSATNDFLEVAGNSVNDARSEIVTAINRVNVLYERDFGIRLLLVQNDGTLIERANENFFTNESNFDLLAENITWLGERISSNGYDIGHVFATAGGGVAYRGAACLASFKAGGVSGVFPRRPQDVLFYLGTLMHEIGHQLGANHTFNATTTSCGSNRRSAVAAVEPGSGSTVMSYSGLCGAENIQIGEQFDFHAFSIDEVNNYTNGGGSCYGLIATNNSDPVINLPDNAIIPARTPFRLDATVTDVDSSNFLHQWNPMNPGGVFGSTDATTIGTDIGTNPLFRVYEPRAETWRDFPALGTQLNNQTDGSEVLPTQPRTMNFRLRVDDQDLGQANGDIMVDIMPSSGFRVTSNNSGGTIDTTDGPFRVTWDTADTDVTPINCAAVNVDLLTLSSNYSSYSRQAVATDVANIGCVDIDVELAQSHPRARIQVSCSDNIFYDLSDSDINIIGANSDPFDHGEYETFFNTLGLLLSNGSPGPDDIGTPENCTVFPLGPTDSTPPVITLFGANPLILSMGDTYIEPGATAADDIDGVVEVTVTESVDTAIAGSYTVTYTATDAADNTATATREVIVLDTQAPVITLIGNNPLALSVGDGFQEPGATATDNVDATVAVVITGNVNTDVPGSYTLTYNAKDAAGNEATSLTRIVNVSDNDAPVITLIGNNPLALSVGDDYQEPGATVTDNVDAMVAVVITGNVNTEVPGSYTLTYNAKDTADNEATSLTRIVNVSDNDAPVITLIGDNPLALSVGDDFQESGATATDNVDTTVEVVITGAINTEVPGSYTLTYNAKDAAGNEATSLTRIVNVSDNDAPVITLIGDNPLALSVGSGFQEPGATATDNVDTTVEVVITGNVNTEVPASYTLTYNAKDAAGNEATSLTRIVNVSDNDAPVITLIGNNPFALSVGDDYDEPGATATDNVDTTVEVVITGAVNNEIPGSYALTYNAKDSAGNEATSLTRIVNVSDNDAPVITLNGDNPLALSVGDDYEEPGATATDNVDATVAVVITGAINTEAPGSYTLTYSAKDAAGNEAISLTRIVNVSDNDAPVITLIGDNPLALSVGDDYEESGATATDNVDAMVEVMITGAVNTEVPGSYTLTYNAKDAAGNGATSMTRIVNVSDNDAPVITLIGNNPLTLSVGDDYLELGATATDNVDTTVTVVITGNVNTAIPGSYSVTYSAKDTANNQASITRTVNVFDIEAPVITLIGDNPFTLLVDDNYQEPGATANDDIDGVVEVTFSGTVNTAVVGSYTLTYSAIDAAENRASTTRTVIILAVPDTEAPVIKLNGPSPLTLPAGVAYQEPGATATDNVDAVVNVVITGDVNIAVAGTYTITYNATDSSSNKADPITRTVIVEPDTEAPLIKLNGENPFTLSVGAAYQEPGATATDNVDETVEVVITGSVDTAVPGTYTITYNAIDAAGNQASNMTRTVNVIDTNAPVITLNGDNPFTLSVGVAYQEPGATASDNVDVAVEVTITGTVDTAAPGAYTITYDAKDTAGNAATSMTRTVNVVDTDAPEITLIGDNPLTLSVGIAYQEPGATVSDNVDTEVDVVITGTVDTTIPDSYTLTYDAIDAAGNQAVSKTRTVKVVDTNGPEITLIGDNPLTLSVGVAYQEPGATATDNVDETVEVVITGSVDTAAPGTYTIIYNAIDAAGNQAISKTRTVNVVDTDAPKITLIGLNPFTLSVGNDYQEPGATATDNVDATVEVVITGDVNSAAPGTYTITYAAKDTAGNQAISMTRTVNVVDTDAPEITLIGDNPLTLSVGIAYQEPGATASDNVDTEVDVVITGTVDTTIPGSYTLTYDAKDAAGNAANSKIRTVNVVDTDAPEITLIGDNLLTLSVGVAYQEPGATAIDNVDAAVDVVITGDVNAAIPGSYILTYDAIDAAGNQAISKTRTVNMVDTDAPEITLIGLNPFTLSVGNDYQEPGATATDNVDATVEVVITGDVNSAAPGTYTITYAAKDAAGNAANRKIRTVNVVDTDAPEITLIGENPFNLSVGETYQEPGATASDNVDTEVDVVITGIVDTTIPGSYTLTYDAKDAAGNPASRKIRTVNVVDTDAPEITLIGENPFNLSVGDAYQEPGATATDNVDETVEVMITGSVDTAVPGTYTIIYNAIDAAGNQAISKTRTVNVVDTDAPEITLIGLNPFTLSVGNDYQEPGATATDNVDATVEVVITGDVNSAVVGSYTVTYSAKDTAGNAAIIMTRTVNVVDTDAPVITLNGSNPINLSVGDPYQEFGASAIDNVDETVEVTITGAVNTATPGSYTLTYDAKDAAGNEAISMTRTVNVADTDAPLITLIGDNPLTLSAGDRYQEPGATATDNVDAEVEVVITGMVDTTVTGSYTVTYSATDAANNAASTTRTVIIEPDTEAPVITLNGPNPFTLSVGNDYQEPGATAADRFDGMVEVMIMSTVDTAVPGSYTVTYNATDAAGNAANTLIRSVIVEPDTEAPEITLNGANPLTLSVDDDYQEAGATATDNLDAAVEVVITGTVDTTIVGSYTVTYNAKDAAGNAANTITRSVIVEEVNKTLALAKAEFEPSEPIVINYFTGSGSRRDWIGLYSADEIPTDGKSHKSYQRWIYTNGSSGSVSLKKLPVGDYVAILFSDNSWNFIGEPVAFKIVLGPDLTAPVITLNGGLEISVTKNSNFADPGWSAIDVRDGDISSQVTVLGEVDTSSLGDYKLTYSVTDQAGNSTSVTRTVNVTEMSLTLAPVKSVFSSREPIEIDYFTGSGSRRDWIGLYRADEIPTNGKSHRSYRQWVYTNGRSGQAKFRKLPKGDYVAILFSDNGWNFIGEPVTFSVKGKRKK